MKSLKGKPAAAAVEKLVVKLLWKANFWQSKFVWKHEGTQEKKDENWENEKLENMKKFFLFFVFSAAADDGKVEVLVFLSHTHLLLTFFWRLSSSPVKFN